MGEATIGEFSAAVAWPTVVDCRRSETARRQETPRVLGRRSMLIAGIRELKTVGFMDLNCAQAKSNVQKPRVCSIRKDGHPFKGHVGVVA